MSIFSDLSSYLEWPQRALLEHIEYLQSVLDEDGFSEALARDILAAQTALVWRN